MTQEEKQILLRDLCARVPYKVQCEYTSVQPGLEIHNEIGTLTSIDVMHNNLYNFKIDNHLVGFSDFKPFLRPMSSMTEEEEREVRILWNEDFIGDNNWYHCYPKTTDFYLSHHLDFRELIPMGLALEAPKDMYKTE